MTDLSSLSPDDQRHVNALTISYPITASQALALYHLAGDDWKITEATLLAALAAGEECYPSIPALPVQAIADTNGASRSSSSCSIRADS